MEQQRQGQTPTINSTSPQVLGQRQNKEHRRVVLYSALIIIGTLLIGFIAGLIDNSINPQDKNAFIENSRDILIVIASSAPWATLFFLISAGWIYLINRLFIRWNRAFSTYEHDEAYGKGLIYELVKDNNAAAALVLTMPLIVIALVLIYIGIINHA